MKITKTIIAMLSLVVLLVIGVKIYHHYQPQKPEPTPTPAEKQEKPSQPISKQKPTDTDEVLPPHEETSMIYGNDAENKRDCIEPFDKFDEEAGTCYAECKTDEECDTLAEWSDDDFNELAEEYEEFSKEKNHKIHTAEKTKTKKKPSSSIVEYKRKKGGKFVLIEGKETKRTKEIIKKIKAISPSAFSDKYIQKVTIVPTADDGDTAAYVEPDIDDAHKRNITVAEDIFDDGTDVGFVLVHEFAHILTLNSAQISDEWSDNCKTYYTSEGCTKSTSYLSVFYQKFRKGKFAYQEEEDEDAVSQRFDENIEDFTTIYAATSPEEDIADSFASFIFTKKPSDTTYAVDQKIKFFYQFPELVKMRKTIIKNLIPSIKKRKNKN